MAKRAEARYVISADDQTKTGINSATRGFQNLERSVFSFSKAATIAGTAAVTALIGIATAAIKSSDRLDDLAKRARDLNVTPEIASGLELAAERAGVSPEKMIRVFERVQKASADARAGMKESTDVFESIGIDASAIGKLSAMERLVVVLHRLKTLRDEGVNVQRAQEMLLGRSTGRVLDAGAEGVVEALQFQLESGAALDKAAAAAERLEDAQTDLWHVTSGFFDEAASSLFPRFTAAIEGATAVLGSINRARRERAEAEESGLARPLSSDTGAKLAR